MTSEVRPLSSGKKRTDAPGGHGGVGVQDLRKDCRDNVGKGHLPAGTGDNLQRPDVIVKSKTAGGIWSGA